MIDFKGRFAEFENANYFSRVDNSHILELYIGLDDKKRKSIELRAEFKYRAIKGTSSIEVNQYKKDKYNIIRFSLCDDEISGLFYTFCDDLIEQTRFIKEKTEGYHSIISRFYQWKKMFITSKNNFLTEPEIMGLIGEILFLRNDLAQRIGLTNALKSWSGQELTHKDFSWENQWFESKTISRGNQLIKISSLEQLESDYDGELVVHVLEKMSLAYNGITLNKLVLETASIFDNLDDKDTFLSKVALQGYEYNDHYDEYVYELSNFIRYTVNQNFPKLIRKELPIAIRKASYEIALTDIRNFEILSTEV